MDFFLGVFVGALTVGGIVLAKVMAAKAVAHAEATPNRYLTGWQPHEADDTGHVSHRAVVPDEMEQSVIDGWQERARRGF